MTPEVFAEWLRRQGVRVVQTESSYWHAKESRVFQAFPYHRLIQPPEAELAGLLKREAALGLRYSTPVAAPLGLLSYHVVQTDHEYTLERLEKKARYDLRKGLAYAQVEPISFARLAADGWSLRLDTLGRQGRLGAESQAWWQRLCLSAEGLPGFEAWGALREGQLAACLLAFVGDGCASFLYQQSADAHLRHGVNHALAYEFSRHAFAQPGVEFIFYSLHSLDARPSVDQFKFRLGFVARPVRQRVVFHPWAAPFFNRATYAALRGVLRWRPGLPALAKAEGMIRFYLEGRLPLARQAAPAELQWAEGGKPAG